VTKVLKPAEYLRRRGILVSGARSTMLSEVLVSPSYDWRLRYRDKAFKEAQERIAIRDAQNEALAQLSGNPGLFRLLTRRARLQGVRS
jgi:hypothetical protein